MTHIYMPHGCCSDAHCLLGSLILWSVSNSCIYASMNKRVSNFTHMIQRVTASCMLHPPDHDLPQTNQEEEEKEDEQYQHRDSDSSEVEEEEGGGGGLMEALTEEVFEAVSRMKRAYVALQEAHCPWDPRKMRAADVAVVAELKKLSSLKERYFRRRRASGGGSGGMQQQMRVREVVAPYEAVMEELKKQLKDRDLQLQSLQHKLDNNVNVTLSCSCKSKSKAGRPHPNTKPAFPQIRAPSPQLFEAAMVQVREATKSFTALLLSLMQSSHCDITAAVRSIEAATATAAGNQCTNASSSANTMVSPNHAKYAIESYISQKIFQGFDHETFYIDGSLSILLDPHQLRRDCFAQYRDMKSMDPGELLGILPTCHFGKFCSNKYLDIVHPKMEESLFGNLEQRSEVCAGSHPRTRFYNEFLGAAKAVWLLHLVAFSLDTAPSHFEASRGAEFHPQYMQSVVKFSGGRVPPEKVVGFTVCPGFKLGSGTIIKARVYLMSRT